MKFSIVIINYNNESTLERAIRSALEQDYPNIEVICVDDASTDRSREVLKSLEENGNFIPVLHEENSSSSCSRLSGIERASGDYVLFLDSDDVLMPNCCSTLAAVLQKKAYDMLAFGTDVEYICVMSQAVKRAIDVSFIHRCAELDTEDYRRAFYRVAYEERPINHTIWNKCYSTELARKIAAKMHKDYINLYDDYYFNFVASQYVNSYFGIPDKLICYSFGEGMYTSTNYTTSKLVNGINSASIVLRRCREFAHEQILDTLCFKCIDLFEREMIVYFLRRAKLIPKAEHKEMIKLILDKFGAEQFIITLNDFYKDSFESLSNFIDLEELFPYTRKPIKTVGLYYHRLYNGGTENVLSQMSYFLTEAGYKVVVITDEDANPLDYPLAEGVKRVCLGTEGSVPGSYAIRYQNLRDCILENGIDLFINNAFYFNLAKLDLCTVKSTGCAYMVYCHSSHISGLIDGWAGIIDNQAAYRYADGIITLSTADRIFWSYINRRVFQVNNPLPRVERSAVIERRKHELLWVGRIDDKSKNAGEALEILYLVLQRMGDVTLRMCGYMDESNEKNLREHAKLLNIGDYVIFEGYKSDFSEFYPEAGLLLLTSDFKDFDTTLGLSLAHGLPVVSYELPYLSLIKQSEAVVSVPWRDFEAAANAVVNLLQDDEKWRRMSEAAQKEAKSFVMSCDMPSMWKEIIDVVSEGKEKTSGTVPSEKEFEEYLATSELAYRQTIRGIADLRSSLYTTNIALTDSHNALAESNEQLQIVYSSKRYKLGNILLYLPSKIKSAIWCLRHRGLRYTVSLALEKLRKAYRAAVSFLKGQEEIPIDEEEKKIKFSIVITNRNNESSLERAICSALEQDYADIELICVDDASTDRSREIIGSFENKENFIPIYLEESSGSSCSRLTGIERAGGDYLLFLDSGDMLMPNCCSALAKVLKRKACDILGFGTEPEYTVVKSQSERARLEKHLSPKRARLDSKGYRRAFYEKKQIKHDVRSKCYSIELARKAASKMQKDHINLCDDFYFSFIAALYVNSYCGTSKKLIRHRFGTGIPVADAYTKTELVQDLNSVLNVFRLCREFACEKALEETYFRYISLYEREQIFGFLERIKFLPKSEHEDMTKLILEQFGAEQFIVSLSDFCESSLKKLTDLANPGKLFPYTRRAAKTVGLYCHCLCGDDPGKALCRTADYLTEAGYRVIIISDKDGSPPYCPLAEDVKRICLDLENCEPGNYLIRYRKLRDCILNKHIDIFINYDFSSDFGGLDFCTVKSTGCAYMLYCHSPHVADLIYGSPDIPANRAVYTYADAVVTLSSADRIFRSRLNRRTFQIANPLPRVEYSAAPERRMHELLWVGKTYDKSRNPEDALEILYLVLQRMGDVTLRICSYMDESSKKKLRGHAEQLNLGDHLIFERNKSDLSELYSEAGLLLLTSDFEDFDTTLGLSLAHGLPVVSYELPYLTFTKQSEAVVSVPWRDFEAAAETVLEIFQDEDRWRKMSEAARSDAEAFMAYDMPSVWREILDAVSEGKDICDSAPSEDEFWEYCDTAELTYRQASRRIGEISRGLQGVYSSKRYRLGNILLYLPSKMKDAAVYLRKQDLRHAAQLALNRAKILYEKFIDKIR